MCGNHVPMNIVVKRGKIGTKTCSVGLVVALQKTYQMSHVRWLCIGGGEHSFILLYFPLCAVA